MIKYVCRFFLGLLITSLLLTNVFAYDFPFTNPYVATVLGTPTEHAYALPETVPAREATIQMFPEREVPGILWQFSRLRYSYIRQKEKAPLIFIIAGTGASYNSRSMQVLQRAFYQAGFHVISLTSPTHPNFVVSASTSGVPGHLEDDSADIYQLMQAIWAKIGKKMNVSEFFLTGYSLGAAQSAYVTKLDEQKKVFNFQKVLLINPPVSLYHSVNILDEMLENNIPGGVDNFNEFYERLVDAFAEVYARGENVEFNNDFLYRVYQYRRPKSDEPLEALIGISFRLSSMNMAFSSDVLTKASYVVPNNLIVRRHDNVRNYQKVLARLTYLDYFRGVLFPYFQAKDPNLTEAQLLEELSLNNIEDFLRSSPKFGLIHNKDDVILKPGEIEYLQDVFGERATIFPHGGHCGNMAFPDNITKMVGFFANNSN